MSRARALFPAWQAETEFARSNGRFREMQGRAERGEPLANFPHLCGTPDAFVHVALKSDHVVQRFSIVVDKLFDECFVGRPDAVVVDQQAGSGVALSRPLETLASEFDATEFLPHGRCLGCPLRPHM